MIQPQQQQQSEEPEEINDDEVRMWKRNSLNDEHLLRIYEKVLCVEKKYDAKVMSS